MFNTLGYAKKLEASGFSRESAEAQVEVILEMIVDGVAKKSDLEAHKQAMGQDFGLLKQDFVLLKQDFDLLRHDFASLRHEFEMLKKDFAALRREFEMLRQEFEMFKAEIRQELKNMENRIVIKVGGMMVALIGVLAVLKLI